MYINLSRKEFAWFFSMYIISRNKLADISGRDMWVNEISRTGNVWERRCPRGK
jgi:hypothetical protein